MHISGRGLSHALIAYGLWGGFGLYFHLLAAIPAPEVLIHRIVWGALFVLGIMLVRRKLGALVVTLRSPSTLAWLLCSSLLISLNWGVYIWAVAQARVIETSLGYYLTPLVSVLLGVMVLKERLSRDQIAALVLAAAGVGWQVSSYGAIPWIALALAFLFAFYGLIRKQVQIDALTGLLVETALMTPFALLALGYLQTTGQTHFVEAPWLLIGAGVLTTLPLLAFTSAARLLPLSILGFANYLAPTLQFISAVTILGEPLNRTTLISFALIWLALIVFSRDLYRQLRQEAA